MIKKNMWRSQHNSHLSGGLFLAAAAWQDIRIFFVIENRERSGAVTEVIGKYDIYVIQQGQQA